MGSEPAPRGSFLVVLPLLTFALLGLGHAWGQASAGTGIDFYQFWSVGQAVREHLVEDVYAPESWPRLASLFMERAERGGERRHIAAATFRREEIQTSNTPFLYAAFHFFESGDYETDIRRFRVLGMAITILSIVLLCRAMGYTAAGTLAALAFALWAFAPLHYDLSEGNVNAIQMTALGLYLVVSRGKETWRSVAAGAILGLGAAFKPNLAFVPLVLVVAWAIRRDFRTLATRVAGMAAGGLLAVALSAAFFGAVTPWFSWLGVLRHIQQTFGSEVKWGSFGGARLLLDLTGRNLSPVLYLAALGAIGFAVRASRDGDEVPVACIGPLVPILAADLAWPHYLVQAIPLAIWLARPRRSRLAPALLLSVALAAVCSSPILDRFAAGNDYAYAGSLAAGTLILFVLGCMGIARGGGESAEAAAVPGG